MATAVSSSAWSRHRSAILFAAALTVGLAVGAGLYLRQQREQTAYTVSRSDIVQSIVASGRVETPLRVDIGSAIVGTVSAVPVLEGQRVTAGQLLVELDDSEAKANVAQARAALDQAQVHLRQMDELNLPQAREALRQAEANLADQRRQTERTRMLREQGFVGQSQLDDAQRNLDVAASQLRSARLQVTSNAPGGSDYLAARVALEQAQANLRIADARLAYTRISAPRAGVLIARDVERGAVVQPGKALMSLAPDGQTQLVAQIDEKNLGTLQLGQHALASADAYPSQRFPAELVYINPSVDPTRGAIEVKLNVGSTPVYLRQDMTVSVDIAVASHAGALTVDADAIHDSADGQHWVMKVVAGHARRAAVGVGIRSKGKVELLSGAADGDVLLSASASAREGQAVSARPANTALAARP